MAARKKHLVAIVAALGLLALGGYAYFANQSTSSSPQSPAGPPSGGKPGGGPPGGFAVGVESVKVAASGFQDEVAAVGSLKSNESVVLRPEIAGRIAAIHLREGMPAARGAVLVALDAATQAAELRQAEANLALSQANFKRTEDLYQKKFVAERARDEAAANLKVLEAAVALAQAKLQKTQIRAPFAGIVGIRNVSVGDYVKEGQELINIEDIGSLKVDFRLPESYLSRLQKGQTVEVSADAMPGQAFRGMLDAIDPLLDASGRAISLRARLANPELKLRPGMFVRVRLAFGGERQGLALPEEALVPAGNDNFVFKVAEGKAQRVMVKIGQRRGAMVEIVEGLKAGDEVVTAGQLKLRDGVPVRVTEAETALNAKDAKTQRPQR
ncbi:MAG: efflux RND transporter periplasmic adaptor subunit [Rhodocyclales bacterium]|nr:efflux RND transporter periplasmic adaptor subunit [Rhodocyclales bacterium]